MGRRADAGAPTRVALEQEPRSRTGARRAGVHAQRELAVHGAYRSIGPGDAARFEDLAQRVAARGRVEEVTPGEAARHEELGVGGRTEACAGDEALAQLAVRCRARRRAGAEPVACVGLGLLPQAQVAVGRTLVVQRLEGQRQGHRRAEREAQARFCHLIVLAAVADTRGGGDGVGPPDHARADVQARARLHERRREDPHLALARVEHVVDPRDDLLFFDQACSGAGGDEHDFGGGPRNEEQHVGEAACRIPGLRCLARHAGDVRRGLCGGVGRDQKRAHDQSASGGMRAAQGRASSSWAARRKSVASSP